ncbi:hypothetical protein [Priestia megaterium]|uniref:hypothetical protein n=1 Tax=Priestia megaterium TaxID=1404 RepID=UPI00286730AF|nr:hypothetical protein [Priestia megaterium]MDR7207657.1 hypothetical protein [Priestia megaterium]
MNSITSKKHYLTNSMTGFKNILGSKITSVVNYCNEPEILYINMYMNPTVDPYTSVDKVETTVIYNMATDSFKVKVTGKGSRKYGKAVKEDATMIIKHLVKEANDFYKGDVADAVFMTQIYAHDALKEAGYNVAVLNEINCNISHNELSVEVIVPMVEDLVAKKNYPSMSSVKNKDHRRGTKKFFMATGVSPMDSDDFSWAEKGWIYEGYETTKEGVYSLENPLERFSYEEFFRSDQVKEISEELYNHIYKMNCKEEGWGDEETEELEEIMKEVFKEENKPVKKTLIIPDIVANPSSYISDWQLKTDKLLEPMRGLKYYSFDSSGYRIYFATQKAYEKLTDMYTVVKA